jgi:transcriptional regulator with XRE-family HTH domain
MNHALELRSTAAPPNWAAADHTGVGTLLRAWREKRRLSQMALALEAGISPRHLSFVETGRSRPSAELIGLLAQTLHLPLRERNQLLLAGGFAPRHSHAPLDAPALAIARQALQRLLDAHNPYPGLAFDRHWNVVLFNTAATHLLALLPSALKAPPVNMLRASLHPDGFAAVTENFEEWGGYLLNELAQMEATTLDPQVQALLAELRAYPNVRALTSDRQQQPATGSHLLVPCILRLPQGRLSMFTAQATFGSPRDVTLAELTVELFYPSDEASGALLHSLAVRPNSSQGG